jgi:membrane-associated phospholipid phosphatase
MILLALLFSFTAHANPDDWAKENLAWKEENRHIADTMSDIGLYGLMGGSVIYTYANQKEKRWERTGSVVLAHAVNQGLNQAVKHLVGRERPDASDNKSFYSGHTSSSFVASATFCAQKNKVMCAGSLILATSVGLLRIAANKHYLSDVLVGGTIGYVNGYYIPQLIVRW